jgi:hypothetical protein
MAFTPDRVRELIEESGSRFVSVNFIKKDGTERQITFNPRDFADIKGTGTPTTDPHIFRIRDNGKQAWRSFDSRRLMSIRVNKTTYTK